MEPIIRGEADFITPLPSYNNDQLFSAIANNRQTTMPFFKEQLKIAPLSDWGGRFGDEKGLFQDIGSPDVEEWQQNYKEQRPFMTASIDTATGELQWAPLSLLEGKRIMMAAAHTGGVWGMNAQNENLAASLMFAGRQTLEDTWLDISNKDAELEDGSIVNTEQYLRQWISDLAHLNIAKGFTGSSEDYYNPISGHINIAKAGGWYDTPYQLFKVKAHVFTDEEKLSIKAATEERDAEGNITLEGLEVPDEYNPEFMYEYMKRVNPSYMTYLESVGLTPETVTEARNQHEWFYMANMVLQLSYARNSIMWSDKTNGAWKHAAGGVYSFVVDGILNEPDMVGEMVAGLVITAATAGVGSAALIASLAGKLSKLGDRALDLNKQMRIIDRMAKVQSATRWLPSALPHWLITKKGAVKAAWYNPFTKLSRNLFLANSAEGALTGGLAEIRNQANKIEWGMQDEYDWKLVGLQSLSEAAITPFINPAFSWSMGKLGQAGMGVVGGGAWVGSKVFTPKVVPAQIRDAVRTAAQAVKVNEDNLRFVKQAVTGSIVGIRISRLLANLKIQGKDINLDGIVSILSNVVFPETPTIEQLQQVELDLLKIIKEHTTTDSSGKSSIDTDSLDIIMAVAKLAGAAAQRRGIDSEGVQRAIGQAFLLGHAEAIAQNFTKRKKRKPGGKKAGKTWTAQEVLVYFFGTKKKDGTTTSPKGDTSEFFGAVLRDELDEYFGDRDITDISEEEITAAWEAIMEKKGKAFADRAMEVLKARQEIVKNLKKTLEEAIDELGIDLNAESLFLDESITNSEVLELRKVEIQDLAIALAEQLTMVKRLLQLRVGRVEKLLEEDLVETIEDISNEVEVAEKLFEKYDVKNWGELLKKIKAKEVDLKALSDDVVVVLSEIKLLDTALLEDPSKYDFTEEELKQEFKAIEHLKELTRIYNQLVLNSDVQAIRTDAQLAPLMQNLDYLFAEVETELGIDIQIPSVKNTGDYKVVILGEVGPDTIPQVRIGSLRILRDGEVEQEGVMSITHIKKTAGGKPGPEPKDPPPPPPPGDDDVPPPPTPPAGDEAPTPPPVDGPKPGAIDVEKFIQELDDAQQVIERVEEIDDEGEDVSYYRNKRTGKVYSRVTKVTKDNTIEPDMELLVQSGGHFGTEIDNIARAILLGEEVRWEDFVNEDGSYIIETEEEFNKLVEGITKYKEKWLREGYIIKADRTFVYDDQAGMAGELDILLIHPETGVIKIVDLKTKRRGGKKTPLHKNSKYVKQRTENHTKQLSAYAILMSNTHGVEIDSISVINIIVEYGDNDFANWTTIETQTSEATVIPKEQQLELRDRVELTEETETGVDVLVKQAMDPNDHAALIEDIKAWIKEEYGEDIDITPTDTSSTPKEPAPINDADTQSVFTTIAFLMKVAKEQGNFKMVKTLERLEARLRWFEENNVDDLPITEKVVEASLNIKALRKSYTEIEAEYFKNKAFKEGMEAERDAEQIAPIIARLVQKQNWLKRTFGKLAPATKGYTWTEVEQKLIDRLGKKYLKKGFPKGIEGDWEAKLYTVRDAILNKKTKLGEAFATAKAKYDKEIDKVHQEELKALQALRREVTKANVLVVQTHGGKWATGLIDTAKDLATAIEEKEASLERAEWLFNRKWEYTVNGVKVVESSLPLSAFESLFGGEHKLNNIRRQLENRHGKKDQYTRDEIEPLFDKMQERKRTQISKMGVGHINMLGKQVSNLAQSIIEADTFVIDQWDPDRPAPIKMTTLERATLMEDEANMVTSSAQTNIEVATALGQYARRLLYTLNSAKWSDAEAIPHWLLKKALPGNIYGFRPELIFKDSLVTADISSHDMLSVTSMEFEIEGVKKTLALLISRLDTNLRQEYAYTAETLRQALNDPDNQHSKYSIYAARKIITMLKNAQIDLNTKAFDQRLIDNKGEAFKIVANKTRSDFTFGDEKKFLEHIHKVANNFIQNYLTDKGQNEFFHNTGINPDSLGDIPLNDLFQGLALFLNVDPATYFIELGNGKEDYASAAELGVGLVQLALRNAPGTIRRIVDKTDPADVEDNWALITDPDGDVRNKVINKDSSDDFDTSRSGNKMLLAPLEGDVQRWAPVEDWTLMRVLEDEIYRNRIKYALNVEITADLKKEWRARTAEEIIGDRHPMHNVGRRVPFRLSPYINNKTPRGEVMDNDQLIEALMELQLDMGPVLEMYIHDAIIGFRKQFRSDEATQSEWFGTGFDVVVPTTSLGRLSALFRLQPHLFSATDTDVTGKPIGHSLMYQIFEQALRIEDKYDTFDDAMDNWNENDQSFAGLHTFWFMDLTWEEMVDNLQGLIQSMSNEDAAGRSQADLDADPEYAGWKVDLIDRYITSGLEWASAVLQSNPDAKLDKFKTLFTALGIDMATTTETRQEIYKRLKKEMKDDPEGKFETVRERLFKPGPLTILYGGGKEAFMNAHNNIQAQEELAKINSDYGLDLTMDDLGNLSEFLYQAGQGEGSQLLRKSMNYSAALKRRVFEQMFVEGGIQVGSKDVRGGVGPGSMQSALDAARSPEAQAELKKLNDALTPEERKFAEFIMRASDAQALLNGRIAAIADLTNKTVEEVESYLGKRLEKVQAFVDEKVNNGEAITDADMERINEMLTGDRMAWRDIQALRAQNLQNSVAHYIDPGVLELQARIMGYDYDPTDLMGLQDHALYFAYARSHDSKRYYQTVFDTMNIHPVNISYSKVATRVEELTQSEAFKIRRDALIAEGVNGDAIQAGTLTRADIEALYGLLTEDGGKAPLGMWNLENNRAYALRDKYFIDDPTKTADERQDAINAWKAEARELIEESLIRDEMLYEAAYGPIATSDYMNGTTVTSKSGEEFEIFSELDAETMYDVIAKRWKESSLLADNEYDQLIQMVRDVEALRKANANEEAELMYRQLLLQINKQVSLPMEVITQVEDLGARIAQERYPSDRKGTAVKRGGDVRNASDLIGLRTANPGGYAGMRPLIKQVSWEQVGSLALREKYYDRLINELEAGFKDNLDLDVDKQEELNDVIPLDQRQDIDIYADSLNEIVFPELDIDEKSSLLSPTKVNVKNHAYRLKTNLDSWAAEVGIEIDGVDKYPTLYYLKELDEMFGFLHSDVVPPANSQNYNIMMGLRTIKEALASELPLEIYKAKFNLLSNLYKLYRISYGIKTRGASHLSLHEEGAAVGIKFIPEAKDGILSYTDMIRSGMTGRNLLQIPLMHGLQGEDYMLLTEDSINAGEYIRSSATVEGTDFMQGIDADMLFVHGADQWGLMDYITEKLETDYHVSEENIKAFREGALSPIISPETGGNKISLEDYTALFLNALQEVHADSISNFDMFLIDTRVQADGTLVPLDIQAATTDKAGKKNVSALVKRSPLATITLRSATIVGERKVIGITPETLMEAINTLSNYKTIEMMEYAVRHGVHVNTRAIERGDGKIQRTAREALSSNLRQKEGFNFTEDRHNEQMLHDAMEFLVEEGERKLKTVGDDQTISGKTSRFLDAEHYITTTTTVKLFPGAKEFDVPVYKAAFLSPVQRILHRLDRYGSRRIHDKIGGMIESEDGLNLLMVLGFMLRNPHVTSQELVVVMPWLTKELTNLENKNDSVFDVVNEFIGRAEGTLEDIKNELMWREMSPDISFHGIPIEPDARGKVGWQGKANPIAMLARSHWENMTEDVGDVDIDDYFRKTFLPFITDMWHSHVKKYYLSKEHAETIKFIETNLDSLGYVAYLDSIETIRMVDKPVGESMKASDSHLTAKDLRWRASQRVTLNAKTLKRLRKKSNLLEEYRGNAYVYPHLVKLLDDIDNITKVKDDKGNVTNDGFIDEIAADALRSAIGYLANVNPEFVIQTRIEKKRMEGLYVGFAQKRDKTEANISFKDLYDTSTEIDENVRDFKNMLLLSGMTRTQIDTLPEFKEGWDTEVDRVVGLDIETNITNNLDLRKISVAAIVQSSDSALEYETFTRRNSKGDQWLTEKQAKEILNELERLQNEGVKVATFNGNSFDLLTLGKIAKADSQAARIALRSFDAMQILKYSNTTRADVHRARLSLANSARAFEAGEKFGTSAEAAVLQDISLGLEPNVPEGMNEETYNKILEDYGTAEEAEARLMEYVVNDTMITANLLVKLIQKRQGDDSLVTIRSSYRQPAAIEVNVQEVNQSWNVGKEAGQMPRSMVEWNGRGIAMPKTVNIKGDPTNDPGYFIGLDHRKLRRADTASAIEVLFHELSEIAILKYMNENSAAWSNLVAELRRPENLELLNKLVKQSEGNKSNLATGMKMAYFTDTSKPNELVAAFTQYYLAARVLGDPRGTISEEIQEIRSSGFFKHLKKFMGDVFGWIRDQFQGMAHIFVDYMDESPREFDHLMTMLDAVMGIDAEGVRMPDVGNLAGDARFTKLFDNEEPFELRKYDTSVLGKGEELMTDEQYLELVDDKQEVTEQLNRLRLKYGDSDPATWTTADENLYSQYIAQEVNLDNMLKNHGYAKGDKDSPEQFGRHIWGLTRQEQVEAEAIINEEFLHPTAHKTSNVDYAGKAIIRSGDTTLMAAFAYMITKNMSEHFGGRYNQGIGGALRNFGKQSELIGSVLEGIKGHVLLSSSGAQYTYNSPYTAAVLMSNLLVEGSILTSNSILPSNSGIISGAAAQRRSSAMAKAIDATWIQDVANPFKLSKMYKETLDPEAKARLVATLQEDVIRRIIDKKYDLSKYDGDVAQGISALADEYNAFIRDMFELNRKLGNYYADPNKMELIPWSTKLFSDGHVDIARDTSIRDALHKKLIDKVKKETNQIHPVYLYAANLLPRANDLKNNLRSMQKDNPMWFDFILERAFVNYKKITGRRTLSRTEFLNDSMTYITDPEPLHSGSNLERGSRLSQAWIMVTTDLLTNNEVLNWKDVFDHKKGVAEHTDEIKRIKSVVYKKTIDGDNRYAGGSEANLRQTLQELRKINELGDSNINGYYLDPSQIINTEYNSVASYLTDAFLHRISNKAFFVYDNTFIPMVSEVLDDVGVKEFIELNPAVLADNIAKTHGHDVHEVDAFSEITRTDLNYQDLLNLFSNITNARSGIRVTDGQGRSLERTEQAKLHTSFNEVLRRKYVVLKGVASRYGDGGGDPTLAHAAPYTNDIIKSVYGTNLAFASSFVEGSMAGLVHTIGYDGIKNLLIPVISYLKPLSKNYDSKVARDMLYSLRLAKQEDMPGMDDLDAGHQFLSDTGTGTAGWMNKWAGKVTRHAQRVNQELRAQIDLVQRNAIMDLYQGGQWMAMVRMIASDEEVAAYEADPKKWVKQEQARVNAHNAAIDAHNAKPENKDNKIPEINKLTARTKPGFEVSKGEFVSMEKLLQDEKTSWKLWKKLAAASGWGKGRKSKWRLAMIMAQNGLMTPQAIAAFGEMDSGARTMNTAEAGEHYFHLFRMRQWAQTKRDSSKKGVTPVKHKARMDLYYNMRNALQMQVETIITAPNVMDLNVGSEALSQILHQYRTYPMLFTSQRLIRDASKYDGYTFTIKLVTNLMLDMVYSIITMMAGGYHWEDMIDDLENDTGSFVALLGSRLPMFGLYGAMVMEIMGALYIGKRPEAVSPISLAGFINYITGTASGLKGLAMGDWGDDTQKNLINALRIFPYIGETLVRLGLHSAIRTGNMRGSFSKYGGNSNKEFTTMGVDPSMLQGNPRIMMEDFVMELFPGRFPDDLEKEDFATYAGVRNAIDNLPDRQAAQPLLPQETAPSQTSPGPIVPSEPRGSSLRAPEDIGGGMGGSYIQSPL